MSAAALVEELTRRGLRLSVEGGELKCRGPKAALTPEVLVQLKERKAEVIAHLRSAPEAPAVSPPRVTPAAVERLLEDPPYWLAGSYLSAYRDGRYSLQGLAYAVTAALKLSPYDDGAVDEVAEVMRGLGYPDRRTPPPFAPAEQVGGKDAAWV